MYAPELVAAGGSACWPAIEYMPPVSRSPAPTPDGQDATTTEDEKDEEKEEDEEKDKEGNEYLTYYFQPRS